MKLLIRILSILFIISNCLFCDDLKAQWIQIGSEIKGIVGHDQCGFSVALSSDGSIVAVSSPGDHSGSGYVRVYKNAGGEWIQLGSNIPGGPMFSNSGYSIALSSDGLTLVFGAPGFGNFYIGQVRIYKYLNGSWVSIGVIDGEADFDQSGSSVSLSADGTIVAIGTPYNAGGGTLRGNVRIFQFAGIGSWFQVGAEIDGEADFNVSGWSVSLSSNGLIVAIGALGNTGGGTGRGHVRVYKFNNVSWQQQGSDIDGEADADLSGRSVSLSSNGTIVAIGAAGNAGGGTGRGHVRVYKFNNVSWQQQGSDMDGETDTDRSGWSVSLSSDGSMVAIGAPFALGGVTGSMGEMQGGMVRVYKNNSGVWKQQGADIDGKTPGENSGWAVALSGNGTTVAVGAPNKFEVGAIGETRIYGTCSPSTKFINSIFAVLKGGNKKLVICHNGTNTLKVGYPAVLEHLLHGDQPGSCGTNVCSELEFRGNELDQFIIDDATEAGEFELYPNPAQDIINLKPPSTADATLQIQIYNSLGQLMWNQFQSYNILSGLPISIKLLPQGLYFLKVSGTGFQETKPFTRL